MRKLVFALLGVSLASSAIFAQDSRGSITGQVTDPQRAAVPLANVTVTNLETNVTSRIQTNQSGYFEANLLNPGTYSLTVESAGFKKTARSGVTLSVGDRLSLDIQLEVGQSTQTVEVNADVEQLMTENAKTSVNVRILPVVQAVRLERPMILPAFKGSVLRSSATYLVAVNPIPKLAKEANIPTVL
jgi:hypothetical protein